LSAIFEEQDERAGSFVTLAVNRAGFVAFCSHRREIARDSRAPDGTSIASIHVRLCPWRLMCQMDSSC